MTNDTAVYDAVRTDQKIEHRQWTGRTGTRKTISRDCLEVDQASLGYCPPQCINSAGYIDLKLVRKFLLMLALYSP